MSKKNQHLRSLTVAPTSSMAISGFTKPSIVNENDLIRLTRQIDSLSTKQEVNIAINQSF